MELRRVAPSSATAGELRSFLAKFLFSGDDVYKHVRDLSGGEKGRLALAKLIYSGVNVLVLDEPTNHLDIPSREAGPTFAWRHTKAQSLPSSHDRFIFTPVVWRHRFSRWMAWQRRALQRRLHRISRLELRD